MRRALNVAVDREAMVAGPLNGHGRAMSTAIPEMYGDAHDPGAVFRHDVAAAERMLDDAGLQHVPVKMTPGELSDHYDPIKDEVYLSEANFRLPSVAGAAVAAHEVGHAIQDKISMPALVARGKMAVPLSIGSNLAPWMVLAGLFLSIPPLVWVGVVLFGGALLFHLITLPVEFDASRRALAYLRSNGIVSGGAESNGAQKVLTAAALTYVLAFAMALAQFLHFLGLARSND